MKEETDLAVWSNHNNLESNDLCSIIKRRASPPIAAQSVAAVPKYYCFIVKSLFEVVCWCAKLRRVIEDILLFSRLFPDFVLQFG